MVLCCSCQKLLNVISVKLDGSTLAASGSGLKVATSGITGNEIAANAVTSGKILLANNTSLRARNAGDTADVALIKLDGTDIVVLGGAQHSIAGIVYTFPANNGDAGQFLQSDGSGVLSWGSASSTLQDAYVASNTITTSSSKGDVVIAGTEKLSVTASGGISTTGLHIPNNTYILARNAANSGDINLVKVNAANEIQLGTTVEMPAVKLMDTTAYVQEQYKAALTLTDNSTAQILAALTFAYATYCAILVEYTIKETSGIRAGRLYVVSDGTNVSLTDEYAETADIGVTWAASINSGAGNIEVKYTTTDLTSDRTMQARIKSFQA